MRRRAAATCIWLKPELVAEIEFAGWTSDGNVRQAAFKGLRQDKPAERGASRENTVDAEPRSHRSSAQSLTDRPAEADGRHHQSPTRRCGRTTAKASRSTKLDLAQYFEAVGDWMMPHIKGRPCLIVRAPDGISGETILSASRHAGRLEAAGACEALGRRKPTSRSTASRDWRPAQSGGVELHPVELRARRSRRAGPAGLRSRSRAGCRIHRSGRSRQGHAGAADSRGLESFARRPAARACTW